MTDSAATPVAAPADAPRRPLFPVPTFPFTIGLYLCATLWLQRTGVVRLGGFFLDLLGSWLLLSALSVAGWWLASRFTKDDERRALVALIVGLWSVLYGSYHVFAAIAFGAEWRVLAVWTVLFALLIAIVLKSAGELSRVRRVLDTAGFVLVAMMVPSIIRAVPSEEKAAPWTDARATSQLPDVYIIVPDKYSGSAFLSREYGIDHSATEDSLRKLGFRIPQNVRANYAYTRLALPTLLEGQYVKVPEDSTPVDYDALPARTQNSPLWSELAAKGYRVVFFPTTFGPTSDAVGVHLKLTAPQPSTAQFAGTWIFHSPISSIEATVCRVVECQLTPPAPFALEPVAANEWKFRTLATLPDSGGPIAAFLHLMAPHEPFLYADDCSVGDGWTYTPEQESRNMDRIRRGYAAQIRCLDRLLLSTVTEILARSDRRPVIIIQSDHGRGRVTNDVIRQAAMGRADTLTAQLAERFNPFAAFLFPGADTLMYDGISPVNVVPTLRHVLFGAPLRRQPDRSVVSPTTRELDLTELSPAQLRAYAGSR